MNRGDFYDPHCPNHVTTHADRSLADHRADLVEDSPDTVWLYAAPTTPTSSSGILSPSAPSLPKLITRIFDFNVVEGVTVYELAHSIIAHGRLVWHNGNLSEVRGAGRYVNRPYLSAAFTTTTKQNMFAKPRWRCTALIRLPRFSHY